MSEQRITLLHLRRFSQICFQEFLSFFLRGENGRTIVEVVTESLMLISNRNIIAFIAHRG